MITPESDYEKALGVRPSVSAVIFDRRDRLLLQQRSDGGQWGLPDYFALGRLPGALLPNHRIRIRDARARRAAAVFREEESLQ